MNIEDEDPEFLFRDQQCRFFIRCSTSFCLSMACPSNKGRCLRRNVDFVNNGNLLALSDQRNETPPSRKKSQVNSSDLNYEIDNTGWCKEEGYNVIEAFNFEDPFGHIQIGGSETVLHK